VNRGYSDWQLRAGAFLLLLIMLDSIGSQSLKIDVEYKKNPPSNVIYYVIKHEHHVAGMGRRFAMFDVLHKW
jgi:heme/copper-type cytochrome/quinol oxidase subunit 1